MLLHVFCCVALQGVQNNWSLFIIIYIDDLELGRIPRYLIISWVYQKPMNILKSQYVTNIYKMHILKNVYRVHICKIFGCCVNMKNHCKSHKISAL